MKTLVFILGLIFILLFFPFRVKTKFTFDFFRNFGFITIFLYSIKLSMLRIKFLPFKIKMKSKKKKFYLSIQDFIGENSFGEIFVNYLLKFSKVKSVKLFTNFGLNNNCFASCLISSSFYVAFGVIYSYLANIKRFYNIECLNFPNFYRTNFIFNFTTSIQLNLFLVIISFFKSLLKKLKQLRGEYGN